MSVEHLALATDLSPQMIMSIERGVRGTKLEKLIRIADIFDVSLDYLTGHSIEYLNFASPAKETDKSTELSILCNSLTEEQTDLVLNFVKNLIAYTDEIKSCPPK